MARPTVVNIDIQAAQHNLRVIKAMAPDSRILAVVKANAYGHGACQLAAVLASSVDAFAVACLEEAQILRAYGITQRIVLLEGFYELNELTIIEDLDLELVLHHQTQLQAFLQYRFAKPQSLWLMLETGMHHLGFPLAALDELWQQLLDSSNIQGPPVLMTHFARSEETESNMTQEQCDRMMQMTQHFGADLCLANSGAVFAHTGTHAQWIRPGLVLYGVSPFVDKVGRDLDLLAVMQFRSKITAIQQLQAGDSVGYGALFVCEEAMRVGIVPVGYADGYPFAAPTGTPVLVNGKEVALVGRISMDKLAIDLRTQPDACAGDEVLLWGQDLPVEVIARASQTIPYQLLTHAKSR